MVFWELITIHGVPEQMARLNDIFNKIELYDETQIKTLIDEIKQNLVSIESKGDTLNVFLDIIIPGKALFDFFKVLDEAEKVALANDTIIIYNVIERNSGRSQGVKPLISDLAQYFKYNTWAYSYNSETQTITEDEEVIAKVGLFKLEMKTAVIQNALMYAILVVQSLILFIAYVKRMFYVIILALMAPVMVVFDFFSKSLSK